VSSAPLLPEPTRTQFFFFLLPASNSLFPSPLGSIHRIAFGPDGLPFSLQTLSRRRLYFIPPSSRPFLVRAELNHVRPAGPWGPFLPFFDLVLDLTSFGLIMFFTFLFSFCDDELRTLALEFEHPPHHPGPDFLPFPDPLSEPASNSPIP